MSPEEDICGLCGKPGADKIPHPIHWPGEHISANPFVHSECEAEAALAAMEAMTDEQRERFLDSL